MEISKNTRISDLIKSNKDSIDAIASLAKPLEKLKNPILRKLMASRVTIEEAAKMGGCTVQDFEKVLIPLGFEFIDNEKTADVVSEDSPKWLAKLSKDDIDIFDVREILSGGQDPLKLIMKRFKEVATGKALCIINTFVPVPLVRLLEKDGVETYTKTISANEFHTYFYKSPQAESSHKDDETEADGKLRMLDQEAFQRVFDQFKNHIREIDVRHLEMPGPMQTILGILPELKDDEALYVNHKRVPLYFLEEIADQDYIVNILSISETDVKLLIYKLGN